ncbi:MAG: 3-deoxy-D-manno-octulosonic acid transferase [Acetobacter sp.]|nr:3-deoxy-D-manno-octulosonic acid transferase [Acetobacter sp.]
MIIGMYKALMTAMFPLLNATYIKKRRRIGKEHPQRFNERVGQYTHPRPAGRLYWLHGASVGEAISMLPLIDKLLAEDPELSILVTTGTLTSAEIMQKRLPERAFHQFIPFDVPRFAKRLLVHFKPDAVLWFESELWPALVSEIHKAKIPLILVNGRISDKSFQNWQRFKPVIREILGCFNLCLGQSEQDKNRLKLLGAKRADCYGNLKYAGMPLPVDEAKLEAFKAKIGERPVFFISSTHHNEEEQLAAHFQRLQQAVPEVLILLAPRHPNRGKEIAEMLRHKGFTTALRSMDEVLNADTAVYVADTIGEMGLWYALSAVTFVGGSLINHGGQNFMEPARDKNAVIVGPSTQNFVEMLARAKAARAVWQVATAADVIEEVIILLNEPEKLAERQQDAYAWTVRESAVLDGILAALKKELLR